MTLLRGVFTLDVREGSWLVFINRAITPHLSHQPLGRLRRFGPFVFLVRLGLGLGPGRLCRWRWLLGETESQSINLTWDLVSKRAVAGNSGGPGSSEGSAKGVSSALSMLVLGGLLVFCLVIL